MDEALRVLSFDELPSPGDFESKIESRNVPAVFRGCIKDWIASSKWDPRNGGLDYLEGQVGTSVVEAMLSRSAPIFYGDIRGHEMIPLPFSTFITSCKQHLQNSDGGFGVHVESEDHRLKGPIASDSCLDSVDSHHQVYLAQVPIVSMENKERSQLETLRDDIQLPSILESKALASINLWMNNAKSRSSTHYDPHHNLLCIIVGCKQVVLWPPSAGPLLYPMPIYGEASNHSSVDLESPNFSIHPRAKHSMGYSQKVILHAGDAIFIPEGWFHQVDSDDLTIAVNYWWQSSMVCNMQQHMDAYFLRSILRRCCQSFSVIYLFIFIYTQFGSKCNFFRILLFAIFLLKRANPYPFFFISHINCLSNHGFVYKIGEHGNGQDHMLHGSSDGIGKKVKHTCGQLANGQADNHDSKQPRTKDVQGTNQTHSIMLQHLEPRTLHALHELVSLVHDNANIASQSQPVESTSMDNVTLDNDGESKKILKAKPFRLEEDPVANILWILEPLQVRDVLLAMVRNFPRTLEALIIHILSPVGAEVLTRKFDEMDQQILKDERDKFYMEFYGVFDDQFAAMDAILKGKESFSLMAFKNVLDQYLGVKL